jgi:hypothetical protein
MTQVTTDPGSGDADPSDDGGEPALVRRPEGVDDDTVAAVGKLTEALEWVERARGHLYEFHQLMGHADLTLGEAIDDLDDAGHEEVARDLSNDILGRNVLYGRWTFQIVEEFDDGYYAAFTSAEDRVRNDLLAGRRHVFESELKERERTRGLPGHEAAPTEGQDANH